MKSNKKIRALFVLLICTTLVLSGCTGALVAPNDVPKDSGDIEQVVETQSPIQSIAYVTVDINPSIQLTVEDGLVTGVQAFNDDGQGIVLSCDVIGMDSKTAIETLISCFNNDGYLVNGSLQNSLIITVRGSNEDELTEELKETAEESIEKLDVECDIISQKVSDIDAQTAEGYGLSTGRFIILRYLAEQENISLEEAIAKYGSVKIGELLKLVEDADEVFEDAEDLSELLSKLSEEEAAILNQAIADYRTAMLAAKQAFKTAKEEAHDTYKEDNEEDGSDVYHNAIKLAIETYKQVKALAQEAFLAAVAPLDLGEDIIEEILDWDDGFDFDDDDQDELDDDEDEDEDDQDELDDDEDEDDDEQDELDGDEDEDDDEHDGIDDDEHDDD